MQDSGYEQIDITYDQMGEFAKSEPLKPCRWQSKWG